MRLKTAAALLLTATILGCASSAPPPEPVPPAAGYYDANALEQFALARSYQSQGRHVLAREHLLQALALADNEDFKEMVALEIEATDRAIRSKR